MRVGPAIILGWLNQITNWLPQPLQKVRSAYRISMSVINIILYWKESKFIRKQIKNMSFDDAATLLLDIIRFEGAKCPQTTHSSNNNIIETRKQELWTKDILLRKYFAKTHFFLLSLLLSFAFYCCFSILSQL